MYTRSPTPSGPRSSMRIPRNYSGNAFSASRASPQEDLSLSEETVPDTTASAEPPKEESGPPPAVPKASPAAKFFPSLPFHPEKLFGSFGTEELLILGLILLLRGNEDSGDLLWLLVLLLLIQ